MEIKFNHTAHKEMWAWLSKNVKARKKDWPGWDANGGDYSSDTYALCFACQYLEEMKESRCSRCPLNWPGGECQEGGLFEIWYNEKSNLRRRAIALQIANLPVKDGVETI